MTKITVITVDKNPDTISPEFDVNFAVPYETANPGWNNPLVYADPGELAGANPASCQVGGPGVLGGPDYITLLQRPQTILQTGYRSETFELAAYPGYTFHSFFNSDTATRNVVAFTNAGEAIPDPVTPTITMDHFSTTLVVGYTASVPNLTGATYSWTLSGGTITAGATTATITWTAGAVGIATATCIVSNAAGQVAPAATHISTTVAAPTVATITADAAVTTLSTGNVASIPTQVGCTYAWVVVGGTITSGQGTNSIEYTAGVAGPLTIDCDKANLAGTIAAATQKTVTVNP